MNRRCFSPAEISEALRDLEAGVRVPEVCRRLGVSELTLSRWRRKAGMLPKPSEPVSAVVLTAEQAANRIAGLERRLEGFRLVLITLLEPPELEQAARLLEVGLEVSSRRARSLLGLPPHAALDPATAEPEHDDLDRPSARPHLRRDAREA
jgi:transposase-like protein